MAFLDRLDELVIETGAVLVVVDSIASLVRKEYDGGSLHSRSDVLTKEAAEDVYRTLVTESRAERVHNPGLEEARADVIVGGMCILVRVMRYFGIDELVVSESDILDGLAASLLD